MHENAQIKLDSAKHSVFLLNTFISVHPDIFLLLRCLILLYQVPGTILPDRTEHKRRNRKPDLCSYAWYAVHARYGLASGKHLVLSKYGSI